MRSLSLSAEQEEFAATVTATVERFGGGMTTGGDRLWRELGDTGLLGLGTSDVGGDAIDLISGMRAAGAAGCQGPFLGAILGSRILPDLATAVVAGAVHVSLVADGVAAWAAGADAFVEVAGGGASLVEVVSARPFETLAREPWARVEVRPIERLTLAPPDLAVVQLARAAWIVGAGRAAIDRSAAHARNRRQFGRAIGDFQAVAHQLAEAAAEIGAAWDVVVVAAWRLELNADTRAADAAADAATRAGLIAAYASHQVHGALGFTLEAGLDRLSTGIRQMSLHPPSPAARTEAGPIMTGGRL
ncbi:acyl-CoA dehydrogenase family protein [Desertimonas flava]|uniref:acyl-CoA dehydrogenase family protein n=1 Tax=Desertimonas flava TaxID=2064846 RepID=UPI000E343B6D|nr:acyl-CoA dehydrogenase family protein [Desertimonas flava]